MVFSSVGIIWVHKYNSTAENGTTGAIAHQKIYFWSRV